MTATWLESLLKSSAKHLETGHPLGSDDSPMEDDDLAKEHSQNIEYQLFDKLPQKNGTESLVKFQSTNEKEEIMVDVVGSEVFANGLSGNCIDLGQEGLEKGVNTLDEHRDLQSRDAGEISGQAGQEDVGKVLEDTRLAVIFPPGVLPVAMPVLGAEISEIIGIRRF
ncbi:uncharacterized protein [Nicotiana tomentosiformis]|uniref:uncharacterized protein isoform X3 n=1 Tax=Nicotiana tomentosiformis TaxID=4098 RepID=UPI00388C5297